MHRHPEQYLHKSRFTRYLQYFRDGGPSYMMMVSKHHASSVGFLILGGWGGGGGDDDDIGTQTSRTISPYFRDGRPSEMMMVSKHHASSVGFPDSGGVGGMMTTLVHRHPEQYLHKSRFTRYLQYFRTESSAGDSAPNSKLKGRKSFRVFLICYDDYADDDHDVIIMMDI